MIRIDNHDSHDPRLNLALEEFLVRNRREGEYLLIYVNDPSVILGKHQNNLEEVDSRIADAGSIEVVRRISGGGAVYHDRGNINFSIITDHTPEKHNNYRPFLEPIIQLLHELGVESRLNNRNSLVLEDGRKFSGNAQFASRGRMISHGTLLFNADLDQLNRVLQPRSHPVESRAVQSIRSAVVNIGSVLPEQMDQKTFCDHLARAFVGGKKSVEQLTDQEWEEVRTLARTRYSSWEWNIGRTPQFVVRHTAPSGMPIRLTIKDGHIKDVSPDGNQKERVVEIAQFAEQLVGVEYNQEVIASLLATIESGERKE